MLSASPGVGPQGDVARKQGDGLVSLLLGTFCSNFKENLKENTKFCGLC